MLFYTNQNIPYLMGLQFGLAACYISAFLEFVINLYDFKEFITADECNLSFFQILFKLCLGVIFHRHIGWFCYQVMKYVKNSILMAQRTSAEFAI